MKWKDCQSLQALVWDLINRCTPRAEGANAVALEAVDFLPAKVKRLEPFFARVARRAGDDALAVLCLRLCS